MQVVNFTDYFRDERDVFIANCSHCQVSVSFDIGGHTDSFLFPNSPDPINLTRFIPFAAIKGSMDLRRMLNRSPPALKLLTEDEHNAYYERQAQSQGFKDSSTAMDHAEAKRMAVQNHMPLPDAPDPIKLHEVVEDGQHFGEKKVVRSTEQVSEADEINPRVLNLCLQVHPQVPEQQKMSAVQMLSEIESIPGLKIADYVYLQSFGYYKSIKKLAAKKVAELSMMDDGEDDVPEPVVIKKVKKAVKVSSEE
jgi:hypothetical protein